MKTLLIVFALIVQSLAVTKRVTLKKVASVRSQLEEAGTPSSLFRHKYQSLLGLAPEPLSNYLDVSK
jgi:hypothetical protein